MAAETIHVLDDGGTQSHSGMDSETVHIQPDGGSYHESTHDPYDGGTHDHSQDVDPSTAPDTHDDN